MGLLSKALTQYLLAMVLCFSSVNAMCGDGEGVCPFCGEPNFSLGRFVSDLFGKSVLGHSECLAEQKAYAFVINIRIEYPEAIFYKNLNVRGGKIISCDVAGMSDWDRSFEIFVEFDSHIGVGFNFPEYIRDNKKIIEKFLYQIRPWLNDICGYKVI